MQRRRLCRHGFLAHLRVFAEWAWEATCRKSKSPENPFYMQKAGVILVLVNPLHTPILAGDGAVELVCDILAVASVTIVAPCHDATVRSKCRKSSVGSSNVLPELNPAADSQTLSSCLAAGSTCQWETFAQTSRGPDVVVCTHTQTRTPLTQSLNHSITQSLNHSLTHST